jgi:cytochrome c5
MSKLIGTLPIVAALFCLPVTAQDGWISLEKTDGQGLFGEKCGMCHGDAMGMGTGILGRRMPAELALLENREDLQGTFIETVVRSGFGVMLPLSRGEVSDAQLVAIIDYLAAED